jgi:hypothetical protein
MYLLPISFAQKAGSLKGINMRTLVGVVFYGESKFYDCLVSARRFFCRLALEHWQCGQEKS